MQARSPNLAFKLECGDLSSRARVGRHATEPMAAMRGTSLALQLLVAGGALASFVTHPVTSIASSRSRAGAPMARSPVSISVFGIGGGGSNAVNRMVEALGDDGDIDFTCCNTDLQALDAALAPKTLQLGERCTRGLGAGGKPAVGKQAALESEEQIRAAVSGRDVRTAALEPCHIQAPLPSIRRGLRPFAVEPLTPGPHPDPL